MATPIIYAQRHELTCQKVRSGAVLIYNHIPKCGGLSLSHMLRQCYASSCDVHQNIFEPRATPLDRDFYHGHGVSGIEQYLPEHKKYFYITILRHPWALAQSLVRFFSWLTPLDSFYQQDPEKLLLLQPANVLIQYLGNGHAELAEENLLHKYVFFGLQEFFPASMQLLGQSIPELSTAKSIAKNVSTKEPWHISPATKEAFFERNAADIALYAKAKEEFLRRAGLEQAPERAPSAQTPHLTSSNTEGNNLITVHELKKSIALGEDLPAMDMVGARFENWLHILLHSVQSEAEAEQLYQWLLVRVPRRVSCLFFAHACAQKSPALSAYVPKLSQDLFALCMAQDPQNTCRILVQCRLDILNLALERDFLQQDKFFAAKGYGWLAQLQTHIAWQARAQELQRVWEGALSPLAKVMLQSAAQKIG